MWVPEIQLKSPDLAANTSLLSCLTSPYHFNVVRKYPLSSSDVTLVFLSVPGCCARFSARSSLYIHSKKHLQDVGAPKSRCPVSSCNRLFTSKHSMKAHMVRQHSRLQGLWLWPLRVAKMYIPEHERTGMIPLPLTTQSCVNHEFGAVGYHTAMGIFHSLLSCYLHLTTAPLYLVCPCLWSPFHQHVCNWILFPVTASSESVSPCPLFLSTESCLFLLVLGDSGPYTENCVLKMGRKPSKPRAKLCLRNGLGYERPHDSAQGHVAGRMLSLQYLTFSICDTALRNLLL